MKITFIYSDQSLMNSYRFNRGVAVLSACLKKAGFETSLIHISSPVSKDRFLNTVREMKPDIIAYSYMSLQFKNILSYIKWSNELNILTIHGGTHPTVDPEECFETGYISILCRGDGEKPIVEFCERFRHGEDYTNVENFSFLLDGKIVHNQIRPVIEDIDTFPYMDYDLFHYEKLRESTVTKELVYQASRGCYYDCAYCCNHLQKSLVPNKNKYQRYHSVDRVISEIKRALNKYPFLNEVTFDDDTLTQNSDWFEEFAGKYYEKIGLPYTCNDRVNNIDDNIGRLLSESGCTRVTMGIESGNEYIRRKVMKRPISEKRILNAFSILKKYGIETGAFNIIGMLDESSSSILDTIKLNARVHPDKTYNAYFYPFHGTEAYKRVIEQNIPILETDINDFFSKPVLTLETVSTNSVIFFYRYFSLLVEIYRKISLLPEKISTPLVNIYEDILKSGLFPHRICIWLFPGKDQIVNRLQKYQSIYRILRAIKKTAVG